MYIANRMDEQKTLHTTTTNVSTKKKTIRIVKVSIVRINCVSLKIAVLELCEQNWVLVFNRLKLINLITYSGIDGFSEGCIRLCWICLVN